MDLEKISIMRLNEASKISLHYYQKPLLLLYSGGKDSEVILDLAQKAKIPFEVQHSHTTADAPETVRHITKTFYDLECQGIKCQRDMPTYKGQRVSMWSLISMKLLPPTRLMRYCCSVLKETGGKNRAVVTGVRRAESTSRKNRGILEDFNANKTKRIILNNDNDDKRMILERCQTRAKIVNNVIVDWSNEDIKDYICSYNLNINPLYGCGFSRVGCIGCPMAGKKSREFEFARYSKYKRNYIRAFDNMLDARIQKGKTNTNGWQSGVDVFHWWMEDGVLPGQLSLFEEY